MIPFEKLASWFTPQVVGVVLALLILIGLGGKIYFLQNDLDKEILKYDAIKNELAVSAIKVTTLENSNANLADRLRKLSDEYKKFKITSDASKRKWMEWKAKSDATKYSSVKNIVNPANNNLSNGVCSEGLELNKKISELNYEAL